MGNSMRAIIGFCFLLAALWAGHWFWAKSNFDADHQVWQKTQTSVQYQSRTVQGFPNRLDTDLMALNIEIAEGSITLPRLFIAQLVYKMKHKVAIAKGPITINWQGTEFVFTFDDARTSVEFDENSQLSRIILIVENIALLNYTDFPIGVTLNLELEKSKDQNLYDLRLRLKSIEGGSNQTLAIATGELAFEHSITQSNIETVLSPKALGLSLTGTYQGITIKGGKITLEWGKNQLVNGAITVESDQLVNKNWDIAQKKWAP